MSSPLRMPRSNASLAKAIAEPRVHVEQDEAGEWQVAYEGNLPIDSLDYRSRRFDEIDMYFGGVGAAYWDSAGTFEVAGDPRRTGGTSLAETG